MSRDRALYAANRAADAATAALSPAVDLDSPAAYDQLSAGHETPANIETTAVVELHVPSRGNIGARYDCTLTLEQYRDRRVS